MALSPREAGRADDRGETGDGRIGGSRVLEEVIVQASFPGSVDCSVPDVRSVPGGSIFAGERSIQQDADYADNSRIFAD